MSVELRTIAWSIERLGEAVERLAVLGGLPTRSLDVPAAPTAALQDPIARDAWIDQTAAYLGVEAEPVPVLYREAIDVLRTPAPMWFPLPGTRPARFLALHGRARGKVTVLLPDGGALSVPAHQLVDMVRAPIDASVLPSIDKMLDRAGVRGRRRAAVRRSLLNERLGRVAMDSVWIFRLPPGATLPRQVTAAGLPRYLALVILTQTLSSLLLTAAWWTVGGGVLGAQLDRGWLVAWGLLLVTSVAVSLVGSRAAGLFALEGGALLKRRLLAGALALNPGNVRHEGFGAFLGRVIESSAMEQLALGAGMAGISSTISLVLAAALLARGAGGAAHVLLLAAWTAVCVAYIGGYFAKRRVWTDARLTMTNDLVERMVGHRTRLAQEPRARWHDAEDRALSRYIVDGKGLDDSHTSVAALLPRGWFVVGILGLIPAIAMGRNSAESLAVSVGGVFVAGSALQAFAGALSSVAGAVISARKVGPLFRAAAGAESVRPPLLVAKRAPGARSSDERGALLEGHALVFRHRPQAVAVVRGASLRVEEGDRLLLEGPSGGGKSTLSSLLAGLRSPEAGLLMLRGFDRHSLGSQTWRKRVILVPQFHENHTLQGTVAFNLLMGRRWPPTPDDLEDAERLCEELGLGPLLARMPAGLQQMVGETGWQLSHGEKSRLYIARALLQGADFLLLDESFAALDPETLEQALACVLRRARTTMIIAHP